MYVDTSQANISGSGEYDGLSNALFFDTYIQLYDYTGKLIYANSKLNTYYFYAVNKLIDDYQFALQFN